MVHPTSWVVDCPFRQTEAFQSMASLITQSFSNKQKIHQALVSVALYECVRSAEGQLWHRLIGRIVYAMRIKNGT